MSLIYLRYNTASQEIPLGRFVDSTDGNTEETGLTIANTDIKLWKAGATTLASKNSGGATHIANGVYYAVLDATDTNTLGSMVIHIHVSGALYVKQDCVVLPAMVYDSMIAGTDVLQSDLTQILGVAQSATDLKDFADAGYDPATNKVQGVVLVDTTTTNTDMISGFATEAKQDIIDGNVDSILTDTGTTLPASLTTIEGKVDTVDTNVDSILTDTGTTLPATLATIDGNVDTILADTNELQTNQGNWLTATGFATEAKQDIIDTNVDSILTDTGTTLPASIATIDGNVDSILTDTGTTLPATLTEIKGATFSGATDSLEAIRDRGDAAWTTGAGGSAPTVEEIRAEIDSNSTQLAAILTDTGTTLPATLTTIEGKIDTVDTNVDSILTDTGTTIPAQISGLNDPTAAAIADQVWDETLADHLGAGSTGNALNAAGAAGDPWSTALPGAYGAGTAGKIIGDNINAKIGDVEADTQDIQTQIGTAGAGLTDLGGMSTGMKAEVNAEADTALTDYDAATGTELGAVDTKIDAIQDVTDTLTQITQAINMTFMVPPTINLNDPDPVAIGIRLINSLDDLPSTAEINPGTYIIQRKAIGDSSGYVTIANGTSLEYDGFVLISEVFDSASGYAEGDSIRVGFLNVSVTADGNTHQIVGAGTYTFLYSTISQTMRGTDSAALASVCTEGRLAELDAANLPSDVDAALADTNELQTNQGNWLTATGFATEAKQNIIDTNVDSILTDTGTTIPATLTDMSGATFNTATDSLEAIRNRGDSAWITGSGGDATEAKQDTIIANLGIVDGNVDSILADTGTTIPAQISGLNNISSADVNTACDTALTDYDAATGTELAAVDAKIDTIDTVVDAVKVTTDKLDTTVVQDGAVYDFTSAALAAAPSSSGATAEEVRIEMDANSTQLAAIVEDTGTTLPATLTTILTDTNEIQGELANIIKTDTSIDSETFENVMIDLKAYLTGEAVTDATSGTVEYKKDDGSTAQYTITIDSSGNRTVS